MTRDKKNPLPVPIISLKSSLFNKTGTWRNARPVIQELTAPCRAACPIANDIPRFIHQIAMGDFDSALRILHQENPFPGITARACSRFCMVPCNQKDVEGSRVKIADLEKAAADYGTRTDLDPMKKNHKQVAVVGAGPAGLSAAYFLNLLGYQVTVLEANSRAGGSLWTEKRYQKIPEKIIAREIDQILESGLDFQPNYEFKEGQGWNDLKEYQAVYLAFDHSLEQGSENWQENKELKIGYWEKDHADHLVVVNQTDETIQRWMVTFAVRAGKQAAIAIDFLLENKEPAALRAALLGRGRVSFENYQFDRDAPLQEDLAEVENLNLDTLGSRFENPYPELTGSAADSGKTEMSRYQAVTAAQQCLSCGVCNFCGVCVASCPDMAISIVNQRILIDLDYCKGCGICVQECPRGALRLELEL